MRYLYIIYTYTTSVTCSFLLLPLPLLLLSFNTRRFIPFLSVPSVWLETVSILCWYSAVILVVLLVGHLRCSFLSFIFNFFTAFFRKEKKKVVLWFGSFTLIHVSDTCCFWLLRSRLPSSSMTKIEQNHDFCHLVLVIIFNTHCKVWTLDHTRCLSRERT